MPEIIASMAARRISTRRSEGNPTFSLTELTRLKKPVISLLVDAPGGDTFLSRLAMSAAASLITPLNGQLSLISTCWGDVETRRDAGSDPARFLFGNGLVVPAEEGPGCRRTSKLDRDAQTMSRGGKNRNGRRSAGELPKAHRLPPKRQGSPSRLIYRELLSRRA